jgi:hypothetical protein
MRKITLSAATLSIAMMSYGQTITSVTKNNKKQTTSVQCKRTNVYSQCKNRTRSKSKLCYLHDPNYVKPVKLLTVICNGFTKMGNNCKNKTKHISGFCHNHQPKRN